MKIQEKFNILERSSDYFQLKCDRDNNKLSASEFIFKICEILTGKPDKYFKDLQKVQKRKEAEEKKAKEKQESRRSAHIRIRKFREL